MNTYLRAMIAGFSATIVLSILMPMKSMMGVMPGLDLVSMVTGMAHRRMGMPATPMIGWVIHFMIATVVLSAVLSAAFGALSRSTASA